MTEYIKIKGWPSDHAEKAYRQGFYIEAIQVLHAWVETQARSFLMLVGSVHFKAKQRDTWELADTFSLNQCMKALFVLNHITKDEYDAFKQLNAMRNKVIHQIFRDPHDDVFEGVARSEYDRVYKATMAQADFFVRKNEEIIER